jgi:hypothetical protein
VTRSSAPAHDTPRITYIITLPRYRPHVSTINKHIATVVAGRTELTVEVLPDSHWLSRESGCLRPMLTPRAKDALSVLVRKTSSACLSCAVVGSYAVGIAWAAVPMGLGCDGWLRPYGISMGFGTVRFDLLVGVFILLFPLYVISSFVSIAITPDALLLQKTSHSFNTGHSRGNVFLSGQACWPGRTSELWTRPAS